MDILVVPGSLPALTYRALCSVILVTSLLLARSVTSRPMALTSTALPSSHLLFYLAVEKELVPQTADLAQRALHLLHQQCGRTYQSNSECLAEADQLPAIPTMGEFPSRKTLQKEGTKIFTKYLLREAYVSIHKLERLLEEENDEEDGGPFHPVTDLITVMNSVRQHLRQQIVSLFRFPIREKKMLGLKNTKLRYTRRPRIKGGKCPTLQQDCLNLTDYRLRLLYTLYSRLLRVNQVLDYTVRLSWLAVQNATFS